MDTPTASTPAETAAPSPAATPRRVAVPGGSARLTAEVRLVPAARPDEQIVLQALEPDGAPPLLRLGYRRGGTSIRGPVSATADELQALLALARADATLAALLPAPARKGR